MSVRMIARAGRSAALSVTCLLFISGWCAAANFSADVITTMGKTTTNGKVYVKGDKARRETISKGKAWATIVRADKNLTWILNPIKKEYRQIAKATLVTPSEEELAKFADKKDAGAEKVGGYECKKVIWTSRDEAGGVVTIWRSTKLDWPLKVEVKHEGGGMTTVLKNIKETAPDDSLFELPSGYTKSTWGNSEPPKPRKTK